MAVTDDLERQRAALTMIHAAAVQRRGAARGARR